MKIRLPSPDRPFGNPDLFAALGLLALLVLFYPDLFLARSASLTGDHWEQHYPWAFLMAQSLKQGVSPFWTPLIQCGYPIVAESQMGFFYIPNLFLHAILPFQWAYAYMNVFHFFMAGLGTYAYCRIMGLGAAGAMTAAVVFVFGTGYGGAYYNITSLKTLAWFPWILWAFESLYRTFRIRDLLLASLFMALSILAGYLQVAALTLLIGALYCALRLFCFPEVPGAWKDRLKTGGGMLAAAFVALLLALPQLLLTFDLSLFSNRVNLSEEYAYVGSLAPMSLLTLVYPKLQGVFRGSCIYSGTFAVYFITASFLVFQKPMRRMLWLWVTLGLISLMLALGQWSPLYVGLVKLTHFYSFRIPAKFLIFLCFSLSILAGLGAHVWIKDLVKMKDRLAVLNKTYLWIMSGMLLAWGLVYAIFSLGRSSILKIGDWLVTHFIYGKPGRPRTLDAYMEAVRGFVDSVREILSLSNPWQLWALALIAVSILWVLLTRRGLARSRGSMHYLALAMAVLLIDLYVFAGTDIKKDFDTYQNVLKPHAVVQILMREKESGRLGRVYGFRKEDENLPIIPSVNMLFGIEDIGGYSPLIMGRYFETIGQFGNVNDSNTMADPTPEFVSARMPLLNALDVSHIVSTRELSHPDLEGMSQESASEVFLYRNQGDRARGYFIPGPARFLDWPEMKTILMSPAFDPRKELLLEPSEKKKFSASGADFDRTGTATQVTCLHREPGGELWEIETTGPGFFVVTNTRYPGWEARIHDQRTPIFDAYGLFQAVSIPVQGKHLIQFSYDPWHAFRRLFRNEENNIHGA